MIDALSITKTHKSIVPLFSDLGEKIRRDWSKYNYTEDALVDVAGNWLSKTSLNTMLTPKDIIEQSINSDPTISAYQTDSPFGDLQQIFYRHSRFFIEVLYWLEGTTAIHDHGFSGAFTVLSGSTINAEYGFTEAEKINHHFYLGNLSNPIITRLQPGSVQGIQSGRRFIHAAFHLEKPTISVVVRTHQDDDAMPQFEYRGEHIRLVAEFPPEFAKVVQGLRFIEQDYPGEFWDHFLRIFLDSPLDERYWLLRAFYVSLLRKEESVEFLEKQKKNSKMKIIINSIAEEKLLVQGIRLRSLIEDPGLKLFVALLLNIPDWQGILDYVKQYQGEISVIQKWLETATHLGLTLPTISGFVRSECKLNNAGDSIPPHLKNILNDLIIKRLECIK